jgi:hypothetical protein
MAIAAAQEARTFTTFETTIPWEGVNDEEEKTWVGTLLSLIRKGSIKLDDYSKHLEALRKKCTVYALGTGFMTVEFECQVTLDGIIVRDLGEETGGDVENACLFIAAFLEKWRPQRSINLPFVTLSPTKRTRGTYRIGPEGTNKVRGIIKPRWQR